MSRLLNSKTPAEVVNVGFSFSLPDGVTISSATVGKHLLAGHDPGCDSLVLGDSQIQGLNVVLQVSGGLNFCTYELMCTIHCSDSETFQLAAHLPVDRRAA